MDMLLAATANALAYGERSTNHPPTTSAEEDRYYMKHTLNVILPGWMISLGALLRRSHRRSPERIRATRHA